MSGYHNADASDAAQAGMDYGYPEHLHLQSNRLSLIPDTTTFHFPNDTTAKDGCGFEASSPDPEIVRELFENHECFPRVKFSDPPVQWHESLGRFGTNLIGWSVIAFIAYLLLSWMLD